MCILVKVPMLWVKISNLSLSMGTSNQSYITFAVLLGFYTIGTLLIDCSKVALHFWRIAGQRQMVCIALVFNVLPVVLLWILTIVCISHFIGVFMCDSHNFSIMHFCTPLGG